VTKSPASVSSTAQGASDPAIRVDELRDADLGAAVQMHQIVMAGEFLAGCGPMFLRSYYRAWIRSPTAIALAAHETGTGRLIGLLLGSGDPDTHYRSMVRHSGVQLGVRLVGRAIRRPVWGAGLVRSRGVRYLRGVLRMTPWRRQAVMAQLGRGGRAAVADPSAARVGATGPGADRLGEITHLMVAPALQGRGAGRALVEEACRHGERVDVDRMVVVTPPGWGAERFYTRLGWIRRGEVTSASDERFVRYELRLSGPTTPAGFAADAPTSRDSPASA
jgi:ribosomal protein S18 acetylase RimI-like enzyme